MKQNHSVSERGQVLVFLVLIMVGLLAFTALAVDGGLIFADRRGAQNAADAAVLAGGYRAANTLEDYNLNFNITYSNWDCAEVQAVMDIAEIEAFQQATMNQYPINGASSLTMSCLTQDWGSYEDRYVDTRVQIISEITTSFVHLVFNNPLQNTVEAISRVRPRMPLAFGYAVYAHRDSCPNSDTGGVRFDGTNLVSIEGGGIMSDACLAANGTALQVDVTGGEINYATDYAPSGSPLVSPEPTHQQNLLPEWALLFPEPDCSTLPTATSNGEGTINPGIYDGITVTAAEQLTMNPGLYCFDGNFIINGNADSFVIGNGVTIFMRDGDVSSNGSAKVQLSAPSYVVTDDQGVTGMLIYLSAENDGLVDLTGNSASYYSGTIFGEHDDSLIEIGGTGDMSSGCFNGIPCFGTQLIAGTVKIHGNAMLDIQFVSNAVYYLPARLTLEK
ncbi:MAG TPA: Tad domain-containing protein [Anaerolineales bacterium]|nr:Tad domain-containing protein [Anaerolineales bacterium]